MQILLNIPEGFFEDELSSNFTLEDREKIEKAVGESICSVYLVEGR